MDRHRSKCEKLTKRENNQSRSCKHRRRTHPQTRNKQLQLQTTWWDNEKIINHTYPLCTHLLTGRITETKAFTGKMVINGYIVHGCQASVKLSIKNIYEMVKVMNIWGEGQSIRSQWSALKLLYAIFCVSKNKTCDRMNMVWPIV